MAGWLRITIILTLMFIGIYVYSISYRFIRAIKLERTRKLNILKEENLRKEKLRLQKIREEKQKIVELRRREIKHQFKWLERMNKKIKGLEKINETKKVGV
jgi:hypothetical protein